MGTIITLTLPRVFQCFFLGMTEKPSAIYCIYIGTGQVDFSDSWLHHLTTQRPAFFSGRFCPRAAAAHRGGRGTPCFGGWQNCSLATGSATCQQCWGNTGTTCTWPGWDVRRLRIYLGDFQNQGFCQCWYKWITVITVVTCKSQVWVHWSFDGCKL